MTWGSRILDTLVRLIFLYVCLFDSLICLEVYRLDSKHPLGHELTLGFEPPRVYCAVRAQDLDTLVRLILSYVGSFDFKQPLGHEPPFGFEPPRVYCAVRAQDLDTLVRLIFLYVCLFDSVIPFFRIFQSRASGEGEKRR